MSGDSTNHIFPSPKEFIFIVVVASFLSIALVTGIVLSFNTVMKAVDECSSTLGIWQQLSRGK